MQREAERRHLIGSGHGCKAADLWCWPRHGAVRERVRGTKDGSHERCCGAHALTGPRRARRTPSVNVNVSLLQRHGACARARGVEDALGVGGLDGGGGDVSDMVREEAAGGRAALAVYRVARVVGWSSVGAAGTGASLWRARSSRGPSLQSRTFRVPAYVPEFRVDRASRYAGRAFDVLRVCCFGVLIARQRQRLSCELPDRVTVARPCPPGVQSAPTASLCVPPPPNQIYRRELVYTLYSTLPSSVLLLTRLRDSAPQPEHTARDTTTTLPRMTWHGEP